MPFMYQEKNQCSGYLVGHINFFGWQRTRERDTNFAWDEQTPEHQNKHEKVSPSRLNQYWCNASNAIHKRSLKVATFGKVRKKNFARTIGRPLLKMSKVWTVITEKTSHSAPLLIVLNVDHYGCTGWWGELLPTSCQMWNLPFKNWVDGSPLRAKISRKTSWVHN